jgi:DNA processing protein
MAMLTDAERVAWLRLIRTENIGPITFARLLERFGAASAAIDALPQLAMKAGRKLPLRAASKDLALAELEKAGACGARLVARCEPDYPKPLAEIADAPPLIYCAAKRRFSRVPPSPSSAPATPRPSAERLRARSRRASANMASSSSRDLRVA